MKHLTPLFFILLLAACSGMRGPSLHSDPSKMSGDTLCYRAAYAKKDPALNDEIAARHLDCDAILDTLPQPGEGDY